MLLQALDAFIQKHRRCSELDGGVEGDRVWMTCSCVQADLPVLGALRSWLNSWRGLGDIERGMARQGYDLQLTRYDARGGRATLYPTGIDHSITSATASAFKPSPWKAVEGVASEALKRAEA